MTAPGDPDEPTGLQVQAAPSTVANNGVVSACGSGDFATRRTELPEAARPRSLGRNDRSEREETLEYWLFCGDGSGMREQ